MTKSCSLCFSQGRHLPGLLPVYTLSVGPHLCYQTKGRKDCFCCKILTLMTLQMICKDVQYLKLQNDNLQINISITGKRCVTLRCLDLAFTADNMLMLCC